jgi:parallel beta-helix repeat protein
MRLRCVLWAVVLLAACNDGAAEDDVGTSSSSTQTASVGSGQSEESDGGGPTDDGSGGDASTDEGSSGGEPEGPWQLPEGHFEPAVIPLSIVAPRPEMSESSRYARAYPGLRYEVPVAVLGGAWPFAYELTAAPAGMTIGEHHGDEDYGRVVWETPTAEESPHAVEVTVTDQEGTQASVAFSIAVTTDGFLFVDAANGDDQNSGTLEAPFQTIDGFYRGDKWDATHSGSIVYYRAGTYRTDAAPLEDDIRLSFIGDAKPVAHLGYPGETAIIDVRNGHFNFYGGVVDVFASNLVWTEVGNNNLFHALSLDSDSQRMVVFDNVFEQPVGGGGIGSNSSVIFISSGATVTPYWTISHNTFLGSNGCMAVEAYLCSDGVFEGNVLSSNEDGGIYLKNSNPRWSIRNNQGLSGNSSFLARVDAYNGSADVDDVEVCWNNWASSGAGFVLGYEANDYGDFTAYRNTWQIGHHEVINAASAALSMIHDVAQHDGGHAEAVSLENTSVEPAVEEQLAETRGLVDAEGRLVGRYREQYLGTRGAEVSP